MTIASAVILIDPKYPHNVGRALRNCSNFGTFSLTYSGIRVPPADDAKTYRLPREERLRDYRDVTIMRYEEDAAGMAKIIKGLGKMGMIPVAVEVREKAESLVEFQHPSWAVYVFGPEDGSIPPAVLKVCHRFVQIPSRSCLNLSDAVAVVLYDRKAKFNDYV